MLLCSVYLGEPPILDFFSKKSEKVLAQPSRFPYSTSSLQGGVAQLGERLTGSQEVRGSIPLVSTMRFKARAFALAFLFTIFMILYISFRNACQDPLTRFAESDLIARFSGPCPHLREVLHQFI